MRQKKDMSSFRAISHIDQIDLDWHGVIEASAGTGKTHTIEHLFVSLLEKQKVKTIDEILVVTFTEKAAGELKERIRKNISARINIAPIAVLRTALDEFDTASIYTIHGFCNKLLREYAFENGEAFECKLIDDKTIFQKTLPAILRDVWPSICGDYLEELLMISNYPGILYGGSSPWEARVIELALKYQPLGNDILYPPGHEDIQEHCRRIKEKLYSILDTLSPLVGPLDANPVESDICTRYASLNIKKGSIPKRLRMLSAVVLLLSIHQCRPVTLPEIDEFISTHEAGFGELDTGWKKDGPDYHEKLPQLPRIIELLEQLRSIDIQTLRQMLASATISELTRRVSHLKKSEGLISYNDMIVNLYKALEDDSGYLKQTLQKRYRYALVDEFQDTDMLQWKIFKTLFLDASANRLFIIGDPKQSIYAFRGADVTAYYMARDEMITSCNANYYGLTDNWRSSRELIRLYNAMFQEGAWFSDNSIHYIPNNYPIGQDPAYHLGIDPLCVIDCGECSGTDAKLITAAFIAREIDTLIRQANTVEPNDIAILVSKWSEAKIVENQLKKAGIRYSYYKKEGLYQTREALELSYLLQSISTPTDIAARKRALLTRFFLIPVNMIEYYNTLPSLHPVSIIYRRFIELSAERKWAQLFQLIIEGTGILFQRDMEDRERVLMNLRTIVQDIETYAYTSAGSIQEISEYLDHLRRQPSSPQENYNIQKIDIENPGVQILTIHASKGLQFRIVFISGGFTQRDVSDFWTYHLNKKRIFDLVRNPEQKDLYDMEFQNELERLFYVAFTRARDRLYVPLFIPTPRAQSTSGILGGLVPRVFQRLKSDVHVRWVTTIEKAFSPVPGSNTSEEESTIPSAVPDPLLPDPGLHFLNHKTNILSFTLLKSRHASITAHDPSPIQFGDQSRIKEGDDVEFSLFSSPSALASHDVLPHGKETGLMLHQIFEQIAFSSIERSSCFEDLLSDNSDSARIIDTAIHDYFPGDAASRDPLRRETARLIWNALRVSLPGINCRLCDVEKKSHEIEFYALHGGNYRPQTGEKRVGDEFMHGIIDMIFQHRDRYYIVDWKSNYIEEGYRHANIIANMSRMGYDLQISIYALGLITWLKTILPDYSYDRHFGGIYYLYLRGIDPDKPGPGIFFIRPDYESLISNSFSLIHDQEES